MGREATLSDVSDRLSALEGTVSQISEASVSDWMVPLAAFLGAALAALIHLYIGRRTLKANVIAEARKVWMAELRRELADMLAEVYMPFSSDAEDYDVKKRVYAAVSRVRLRLTPEELRQSHVTQDRDRHLMLESAITKLSRLLFDYMDDKAKYDEVHDQATEVENIARRIFYDTWVQIKDEVEGAHSTSSHRS